MAATRLMVSLPKELAAEMDRCVENRSFFIAKAVRAELERQRKERLIQSMHSESTDMADWGFREWDSLTSEEDPAD